MKMLFICQHQANKEVFRFKRASTTGTSDVQRARATVLVSPSPTPVAWLRAPAKSQTVGNKKNLRGSRLSMLAAELPVRCHTRCFGCHVHRMPVTTACSSRCGRAEIRRQTARVAWLMSPLSSISLRVECGGLVVGGNMLDDSPTSCVRTSDVSHCGSKNRLSRF